MTPYITQLGAPITDRVLKAVSNWSAERAFNLRVKIGFEKAGIQIPFPQRELRIVREVEAAVTKDKLET
jgi:small-conductance mechanosensitive channel